MNEAAAELRLGYPPLSDLRVGLIYHRMSYFGQRSGWPAVVPHLRARVDCRRLTAPAAIGRIPHRILDRAVRPRDIPWYNLEALAWELAGARLLRSNPRAICHFLYGEGAYHYLGRARAWSGRARGRIVCSMHQPPSVFEHQIGRGTRLDVLDAVVMQATNQADHLASRVSEDRLYVVPHGVDTSFFQPRVPGPAPAARLLCVGTWLRDFSTLRQMAQRAQLQNPELRITVVANPGQATEVQGLPNVEVLSGITDRELLARYQQAAALILPLLDTTANNGLLEAMACGLPIIATRVGGVSDYADPRGACLVRPGDAGGMLQAALAVLGDPGRAAAMGAHNRARARAIDWEHIAEALVGVYARVAAAPAWR